MLGGATNFAGGVTLCGVGFKPVEVPPGTAPAAC